MGDAPPLDEDAPDEALLAEDGRSSPTSVGRVRKRAEIGAQLARGWERGVAPSEGASRGAAAASKCARAARRRACGVGEVKLGLLTRASRTTPTPERTMPPSHPTAKRNRRRTRRRRAVASQTTSAMRPPRRRGGRRVPAAGPSSVAGPARPSWPARLPTREDRARGQNVAKSPCLPTLHGNFTSERVGSTTRRLHQRVRLAILYRIDTWYVFSIARGEELRPFLSSVQRR